MTKQDSEIVKSSLKVVFISNQGMNKRVKWKLKYKQLAEDYVYLCHENSCYLALNTMIRLTANREHFCSWLHEIILLKCLRSLNFENTFTILFTCNLIFEIHFSNDTKWPKVTDSTWKFKNSKLEQSFLRLANGNEDITICMHNNRVDGNRLLSIRSVVKYDVFHQQQQPDVWASESHSWLLSQLYCW